MSACRVRYEAFACLFLLLRSTHDEQSVSMIPRQEYVPQVLLDTGLLEPQIIGPHHRRIDQVKPQRIGTILSYDLLWWWIILLPLGHFLAILSEYESVTDQILERRLVKERRAEDHQSIEPASSLVNSLGDEVGREGLFKLLLVLKRIVLLSVRHRATLEPAIKDLVHPAQLATPFGRWQRDVVDEIAMQVSNRLSTSLLKLLLGSNDHHLLSVVAHPHWDGRAPETVSRDRPVPRVLEPIVKPFFLHKGGDPVCLLVVRNELVPKRLDGNECAGDRSIN
mmetsp:Transcript_2549/g.4315  ORF Transcript_2549/g.4315 Transcript_2549/m.4315 type:complete len:280 (-) Transcript_2549:1303-2142(-)